MRRCYVGGVTSVRVGHFELKSIWRVLIGCLLSLSLMFVSGASFASKLAAAPETAKEQVILLAVDGISFEAFTEAQRRGLFSSYKFGAHIAPFPSMSDVAWNSILRTTEVFGPQGRVKSAEAVYFDDNSETIQGDVRDYYRRMAHPKYYMGAFEFFMNPYVEGLMYFPTEEIPKLEIKQVIDSLLTAPKKPVLAGFIAAPDSLAHTQQGKLYPSLILLDQELKRLAEGFKKKGVTAKVILVSDHGNAGNFKEGETETELIKIDLKTALEKARFAMSSALSSENSVAVPMLALGSWAPLYVKNLKNRSALANSLKTHTWFDSATWIHKSTPEVLEMEVVSHGGEGLLSYDKNKKTISFKVRKGSPFDIKLMSGNEVLNLTAAQARSLTINTSYPDSLNRLVEAGLHVEFEFPDLLLTAKDGHCFDHSLSQFTKMFRTHGSMTKRASQGIVAANYGEVPAHLGSKEILSHFQIDPKVLFGKSAAFAQSTPADALKAARETVKVGVPTSARDYSERTLFQHLTRFIADTRSFFVIDEIKQILSAFKGNPFRAQGGIKFDSSQFDFSTVLTPQDIGSITDAIIKSPSPEAIRQNPSLLGVLERLDKQAGTNIKDTVGQLTTGYETDGQMTEAARKLPSVVDPKRVTMKMYQLPHLLEKALTLQERPRTKETRELTFAEYWVKNKARLATQFEGMMLTTQGRNVAEILFEEIMKESALEEKIYPYPLDKIYSRPLKDVTIVYVPGIYNSIFDKEIFSLGLKKLSEDLGLRVITAPVESTCSANYNGQILMKYLEQDQKLRDQRGFGRTRYMLIGYSKGAVDAVHGFALSPEFVAKNVVGLFSIASPLQGSSILDKTDLPFSLVESLSAGSAPEACRKAETAGKSVTPSAMAQFWRKNGRALIGLTRYYSVSFVSEIEDSHLFMKATKLIAQFDEDNDGVVTLTASRFPHYLQALDFGVVQADHLAGILSSKFDQKAFFQSIASVLGELGADSDLYNLRWNAERIVEQASKANPKAGFYLHSLTGADAGKFQVYEGAGTITYGRQLKEDLSNTYLLNKRLLPKVHDPANDFTPRVRHTENQLNYEPYALIDLKSAGSKLAATRVKPILPQEFPNGFEISVNHANSIHFRMEHLFNFETPTVGADENAADGIKVVERHGKEPWLLMRSNASSIRLTSFAYRFKPIDFGKVKLRLEVTKPVTGADVILGGANKDDSAFQVWFTIREKNTTNDRSIMNEKTDGPNLALFGYYWGSPTNKRESERGQLFENSWSRFNYGLGKMPEAWQVLIDNPNKINTVVDFESNLHADLKRAFPNRNVDEFEIVGITFQHDSNNTKAESEAFFKSLRFERSTEN